MKTDGGTVREGAVVTNGTFQTSMPPGRYKVEVGGQKSAGKRKQKGFDGKDEEIELHEELIPRSTTRSLS